MVADSGNDPQQQITRVADYVARYEVWAIGVVSSGDACGRAKERPKCQREAADEDPSRPDRQLPFVAIAWHLLGRTQFVSRAPVCPAQRLRDHSLGPHQEPPKRSMCHRT